MVIISPVAFSSLSIPPASSSSSSSSFVYHHHHHRNSPKNNQTALNLNNLNFYAQQLNNSAALCIEIGHYDRAISSLRKALQLLPKCTDTDNLEVTNNDNNDNSSSNVTREVCTLDACINFSQNHPGDIISNNEDPFWKSPLSSSSSSSSENGYSDGESSYIYRRPIRVHRMGHDVLWSVLIIIVTFNLAIAHHLLAITSSTNVSSVSSDRETIIIKAAKFYDITLEYYNMLKNRYSDTYTTNTNTTSTYDYDSAPIMMQCDQQEELNNQIIESIQFDLILHNNLSQMHHLIHDGCQSMDRTYSQQLLSTLMVVIEPQMRNGSSSNAEEEEEEEEEEDHSSRSLHLYLHGFIQNTMHLILREQESAEAA